MTQYESISNPLPPPVGNFPVHELVSSSRRRNYVCGLINVALMMANVNQFKQMVASDSWKAWGEYKVVFIATFGITILLQLVTIVVLVLDTKLLDHSMEDFRRSAKRTTILLCLAVILVIIDIIAIIVTDDWNVHKINK